MIIAKDRATLHIGAVRFGQVEQEETLTIRRTTLPEAPRKHFAAIASAGVRPKLASVENHAYPTSQTRR